MTIIPIAALFLYFNLATIWRYHPSGLCQTYLPGSWISPNTFTSINSRTESRRIPSLWRLDYVLLCLLRTSVICQSPFDPHTLRRSMCSPVNMLLYLLWRIAVVWRLILVLGFARVQLFPSKEREMHRRTTPIQPISGVSHTIGPPPPPLLIFYTLSWIYIYTLAWQAYLTSYTTWKALSACNTRPETVY